MRRFRLVRVSDDAGTVAEGVIFSSGKAVIDWLTTWGSLAYYDQGIDSVQHVDAADSRIRLVWVDEELQGIEDQLNALTQAVQQLSMQETLQFKTEEQQMSDLSSVVNDLVAKVSSNTDVIDSASTLLGELGAKIADLTAQLAAAGVDPAVVQQLTDLGTAISDEDGKLADAIAANTPAAPPAPAPGPAPAP